MFTSTSSRRLDYLTDSSHNTHQNNNYKKIKIERKYLWYFRGEIDGIKENSRDD